MTTRADTEAAIGTANDADFTASLLRAVSEATLDGVLVVSPEGRIVSWNARFLALWRLPERAVRGGADEVARSSVRAQLADPDAFERRVRALYAAREPGSDELRLADGRVFDRYGAPQHGEDGAYHGYTWFFRDVSAERCAHDALEAAEARYRALVSALSHDVWYTAPTGELLADMPAWRAITGQTAEQLAGYGWLRAVHPGDRDLVRETWAGAVATRTMFELDYRVCPVDADGEAVTSDPAGIRTVRARGVPREKAGTVVEWVGIFVDVTERLATERERERLVLVAAASAERTRALQEVTAALSNAVTVADVLAVILEQGSAHLGADGSGVALRDGDTVRYEVLRGYSADVKAAWAQWPVDEPSPVTHVIRTGQPVFVASVADLPGYPENPRLRAFVEATGEHAWARLPLLTPSGVLGALVFGFERPRSFSADECTFALALAGQCAQAIERAQLYERERSTARLLQRSLLPDALPAVPGVSISALCQPATHDVEVGGDWYDALTLPDGRLALVVGDVMGKGVRAAAVMGQVRNALRGLVHADPSPAAVLGWLDDVVTALASPEELVTLVYGAFDPGTGVLEWANAGHLPPLLVGSGGASYVEDGASLPLGLGGPRATGRLVLEPGTELLLFSDGLVESPTRPLTDGLAALASYAEALRTGAPVLSVDQVRDRLTAAMADPDDTDDVTLLVLRRSPQSCPEPRRVAEVVLPARATSAGAARAFVDALVVDWGLEPVRDTLLLCVSEVVTNAVVHAGSHADLSLRLYDGVLRVEVGDSGAGLVPPTVQSAGDDDQHGRGLLLVDALATRWGTTEEPGGKVVWFETALAADA